LALYQRAIAGLILNAGLDESGQQQPFKTSSISQTQSGDSAMRRAVRLLSAIHELHKAGYQKIRIAAGMAPSGNFWRCHIMTAENVRSNDVEFRRQSKYGVSVKVL